MKRTETRFGVKRSAAEAGMEITIRNETKRRDWVCKRRTIASDWPATGKLRPDAMNGKDFGRKGSPESATARSNGHGRSEGVSGRRTRVGAWARHDNMNDRVASRPDVTPKPPRRRELRLPQDWAPRTRAVSPPRCASPARAVGGFEAGRLERPLAVRVGASRRVPWLSDRAGPAASGRRAARRSRTDPTGYASHAAAWAGHDASAG